METQKEEILDITPSMITYLMQSKPLLQILEPKQISVQLLFHTTALKQALLLSIPPPKPLSLPKLLI